MLRLRLLMRDLNAQYIRSCLSLLNGIASGLLKIESILHKWDQC